MTKIICPGHLLSARQSDLRHWHVERAYSTGYLDGMKARKTTDPLDGFSNLTQAIQDGTRIDWEKLDKLVAKCVHPDIGTLTHYMERDTAYPINVSGGWVSSISEEQMWVDGWGYALQIAWEGEGGWSLWVEGEIPVKKRTADELEPGTCFKGRCMDEVRDCVFYIGHSYSLDNPEESGWVTAERRVVGVNLYNKLSREGASHSPVNWLAEQVEVLEVYGEGTFQNTNEEA